jgi:hypothetical protein
VLEACITGAAVLRCCGWGDALCGVGVSCAAGPVWGNEQVVGAEMYYKDKCSGLQRRMGVQNSLHHLVRRGPPSNSWSVRGIGCRKCKFSSYCGEFSFITHNRLRLSLHSSSVVRSTRR